MGAPSAKALRRVLCGLWSRRAWPRRAGPVCDAGSPWALILFAFAAFTLVALSQEFWRAGSARRALTGERYPAALLGAIGRNRRRYGGYVVHVGIAVLLVGIAASSSFQTNRDLRLEVGESATGDYEVTYKGLDADPENERIAFAATLDVRRDGEQFALLAPARNYYPTQDPMAGPIGRFFDGEATSEIGLRSGAGEDFWAAFQPDLSTLDDDRSRQPPARRPPRRRAGHRDPGAGRGVRGQPAPATFRVIVNPLVIWIWIGALVALGGAMLALWPSAEAPPRARCLRRQGGPRAGSRRSADGGLGWRFSRL